MVSVKICGITRKEDALAAAGEGASAVGFIFVPSSPRRIEPPRAAEIIRTLPPFVTPVGVFVNASRELIMRTIDATGVRCLQLHGDESPSETEGYPLPVIKAFRVGERFDEKEMDAYTVTACLLDASVPGMYGGTGRTFDWAIARRASASRRIILSGGLTPANAARAAAESGAYGIDLSSGLESAPGVKDSRKIRALFENLRGEPAPRTS